MAQLPPLSLRGFVMRLYAVQNAVWQLPDPSIPSSVTTAVHTATGGSTVAMASAGVGLVLFVLALRFEAVLQRYAVRMGKVAVRCLDAMKPPALSRT